MFITIFCTFMNKCVIVISDTAASVQSRSFSVSSFCKVVISEAGKASDELFSFSLQLDESECQDIKFVEIKVLKEAPD